MKRSPLLLVSLLAATAFASSPEPVAEQTPDATAAQALVQAKLVTPLGARDRQRSRFSRARLAPTARRVRVLDARPVEGGFLRFSVDTRAGFDLELDGAGDGWSLDDVVGCVYPATGQVFVQRGEVFYPAALLLGRNVPVDPKACR